jgi:DNA-binding beta-propeller fold protein YncE
MVVAVEYGSASGGLMYRWMAIAGLSAGCSSEKSMGYSLDESADMDRAWGDTGVASDPSPPMDGAGESEEGYDDGFGSEVEEDVLSLRPATTDTYVFVANPDRNTVTRISVPSLGVITAEVGVNPSIVETSSDFTRAVTFNIGSDDLSIIDSASMDVTEVEIRSHLNQMKLSPDGRWAICYHDLSADDGSDVDPGALTYNAISIVDLENLVHHEAIVGSHPHDVQFTEDSSLAVVISDDYLAALDLTAENVQPQRIAIADDLINPPAAEEVLLDPQGRYAIVRQYGVSDLVLVDFSQSIAEQVSHLDVGDNPTDMDVSSDGQQAMVIARGSQEIWIYSLADPTETPTVIPFPEDEVFGSLLLSPDDSAGVLYSTASGLSRMAIWERDSDEIVVRGLVKPVSSLGLSSTGETAIVFHSLDNGDTPVTSHYYNNHALSVVDMGSYFSTSLRLSAEASTFTSTPDGSKGFYIMEGQPYLESIDYRSFVPSEIPLPSVPVHLGMLPDTDIAFVSQQHDLGRISFYGAESGDLQTITGFELNAAIEH